MKYLWGVLLFVACADSSPAPRLSATLSRHSQLTLDLPVSRFDLEITCASESRTVHGNVDVTDDASVAGFARELGATPIDVLVNNAGVLPDTLTRTSEGHEVTFATNVLGPHALTSALMSQLVAAKGRVITIASGGMLTQKLDLDALQGKIAKFDGVVAYAQTKRAEVILSEQWATKQPEVTFSTMHPGWADTPAVRSSLPRFYSVTKSILRTPEQGADTAVWLAVAPRLSGKSGLFWFDRAPASTHPLGWTTEAPEAREKLWALVETACATLKAE